MIRPEVQTRSHQQYPFTAREQDTCGQMTKNTSKTTAFKHSKATLRQNREPRESLLRCQKQSIPLKSPEIPHRHLFKIP